MTERKRLQAADHQIRAVVYCRVSTDRQALNLSIPTQEKMGREYCRRQQWLVAKVFKDKGERGSSLHRDQFDELLDFCGSERPRIDYVIVFDVSRFARGNGIHWTLRDRLKDLNVNLRAVTQNFDESPSGVLQEGIFASLAAYDNAQRRERTMLGMQARIEQKGWPFQATLGYQKVRTDAGPTLVQDPAVAPHIAEAFRLIASGVHHLADVLRQLTNAGLRSRKGRPLTSQSFSNILRNPAYSGWLVVNKWNLRKRGDFHPIVDEVTFERVQQILAGKPTAGKARRTLNPKFPLRGFIRCECGAKLTASESKGRSSYYGYYHCLSCKRVTIKREQLEASFEGLLQRLQARRNLLPLATEIVKSIWIQRSEEQRKSAQRFQRSIAELQERKQRLMDRLLDGTVDRRTYSETDARLSEEVANAEIELMRLTDSIDPSAVLRFGERLVGNAHTLWKASTPKQRILVQQVLFPDGLSVSGDEINGTAVAPLFFTSLEQIDTPLAGMVDQNSASWNRVTSWLASVDALRLSA